MEFILENYIIILLIGLFLVFALIGYLIDSLRKPKKEENIIPEEILKINENKSAEEKENTEDEKNVDLLMEYETKVNNNVKKD